MSDVTAISFADRLVGNYLEALGSSAPAPGGGSAAGLAGTMGCALGEMVCNLTLARAQDETVDELRATLVDLRESILAQAQADERAFGAYRAATALPRSTDAEKTARRQAIEEALIAAAEVPLAMVTLGLEAFAALRGAATVGTSHALGDLLTGGYLLQAMILGSLENIEANAFLMKIPENRERFEHAAHSARVDLEAALSGLQAAVAARRG